MPGTFIITVDGPGGAGKGELSSRLARTLGYDLLDSGAIYRVLAYAARKAGLALFDEDSLVQQALFMDLHFKAAPNGVTVMLGSEDVTRAIRTAEASENASRVAAFPKVRQALLQRQRDFAKGEGLVADGRDMGTVVFPKAQVKIFLDASFEERARRRQLQLEASGMGSDFETILKGIKERDARDRSRSVSPLVPASDAVILDSTNMGIEEVFEAAMALVTAKQKEFGI